MRKTPLRKIGKIGKGNIEANKKLKWIFNDYDIRTCELRFKGCMINMFLTFCHKEPREWYRRFPELLYSFKHVLLGCQNCHEILDNRAKTTEAEKNKIFKEKRDERVTYSDTF